ncbi:MAG TPA: DUF4166 domain-containing protein [Burkholderiaceae bacterium]|nr:DUF4166 domain-containing protein [Burkholderiaceae bacterium]
MTIALDTAAAPQHRAAPAHPPDFEALVGREGWWRLPAAVRARFSEHPTPAAPIRYRGVMQRVECSWLGWLLAQFCRLFGTPFAPWRGRDVPVAITLRHDPDGGVTWEREYRYPHRAITVSSTKRVDETGALRECVGGGFGMRLAVFEAGGALHFLSLRYFLALGRWQLWLPALLSPGVAHVIHEDLGGGRFRFAMTFHHALFGRLFLQDGVFQREGEL